jgi:phosphoglycerate-specific signal transduction histidine kinase
VAGPGPDELCKRRTYSLYEEDLARLTRLEDRFGKPASEIIRLALMAVEGNMRILRHAIAQPVCAIKLYAHLARHGVTPGPEAEETARDLEHVARELERLLAPLDPEKPGA